MRYVMIVAAMALLIAGACGSAGAQTPEEVYQAWADAWNAHDADLMISYVTDDFVLDGVPTPPPAQGKDAAKAFLNSAFQAAPDVQAIQQRVLASGNIVVAEGVWMGTFEGEWAGVPPTGKTFQWSFIDIAEIEGGKMKRLSNYYDLVSWMVQVGVMPSSELPPLTPSFTLPDPEPTGLSPLEANVELEARWNAPDLAAYAKMIHPDADLLVAALGVPTSRDAAIAVQELYLLGMSDRKEEIVRAIDMGDGWVLSEVVYRGTNDGPYFGIPATGRSFEVRGVAVNRFDAGGLLTYQHVYFDNMTLFVQLGLVPAPEPSAVSPASWGEIKARSR